MLQDPEFPYLADDQHLALTNISSILIHSESFSFKIHSSLSSWYLSCLSSPCSLPLILQSNHVLKNENIFCQWEWLGYSRVFFPIFPFLVLNQITTVLWVSWGICRLWSVHELLLYLCTEELQFLGKGSRAGYTLHKLADRGDKANIFPCIASSSMLFASTLLLAFPLAKSDTLFLLHRCEVSGFSAAFCFRIRAKTFWKFLWKLKHCQKDLFVKIISSKRIHTADCPVLKCSATQVVSGRNKPVSQQAGVLKSQFSQCSCLSLSQYF